ncbi:meiosis 1 arrest protein-like [Myxocyprinus asiaticus]|uniref:meiosis 1 arrest protein-like n=1 Tax=Myxocyprinus asiaticus TaxID=70543 RepID=UPI0022238462|nr:meiosis 1 arrest protein-like [Myxocyprinus asiaticus]
MSARNRSCSSSFIQACSSSSFTRQPPRVLIVDASPPWWSETCSVLCQALENFFFLTSSLAGPVRLPLLSVFAINVQLECLLPFVHVKGNLTRLLSCVEELRSLPQEGCIRQRGALLKQAVLDSLQQFKQYMCHTALGDINSNCVEVTVVTCQPGQTVLRQLEQGLKNSDLMSLRKLLVIHITLQHSLTDRSPACSPETPSSDHNDHEESLMLGTEMDLQQVEGTVVAVESALKMWLHDQGGDREHVHLLLPPSLTAQSSTPNPANNRPSPVCLKCDMQERLLSPALLPSTPDLGVKTESIQDFQPQNKSLTNQSPSPQRLRVVKVLYADGVCQSVLYGLPFVIRPTSCWQLEWDEMETNHQTFHALCHTLRTRDWFMLARSEPRSGSGSSVFSYYVLQSSGSLSLLLKPVLTRELMLPCTLPVSVEEPPLQALHNIESSLEQLEKDPEFNPLCLDSNLYMNLRMRGLLTRSTQPFGAQGQGRGHRRDASRPPEGSTQRQQGRQSHSRVRATVAPLPSIPPNKMSRPSLTLSHSRASAPALCFQDNYDEEDHLMVQRQSLNSFGSVSQT